MDQNGSSEGCPAVPSQSLKSRSCSLWIMTEKNTAVNIVRGGSPKSQSNPSLAAAAAVLTSRNATSRFSEEVFHGNSPCPFTDESEPITIHVVCVKVTLVLHYSALFEDDVLCGLLGHLWGCMLATYRSYGGCWTVFASLGLYVGNLQVLWGLLDRLWGCMLATYKSYGALGFRV